MIRLDPSMFLTILLDGQCKLRVALLADFLVIFASITVLNKRTLSSAVLH